MSVLVRGRICRTVARRGAARARPGASSWVWLAAVAVVIGLVVVGVGVFANELVRGPAGAVRDGTAVLTSRWPGPAAPPRDADAASRAEPPGAENWLRTVGG